MVLAVGGGSGGGPNATLHYSSEGGGVGSG